MNGKKATRISLLVLALLAIGTLTVIAAGYTAVNPAQTEGPAIVPLQPLAEKLGAQVKWNPARWQATITKGNTVINITMGRTVALVNGRQVYLDRAPFVLGSQVMISARFLIETLGPASTTPQPAPQPAPQPPANNGSRGPVVLGYYPVDYPGDRVAYNSLAAYGKYVDLVAYHNYRIDSTGRVTGTDDAMLMSLARQQDKRVLLAVHNYVNGNFDRNAARLLLNNANARRQAVDNLFRLMQRGYAGVNIDIENIDPVDRNLYTTFIREIAAKLQPAGHLVTVAIPAKVNDYRWDQWSGGYDYAALGQVADYVVIMSYDEHWLGGESGPVASLGWVDSVTRYATGTIPRGKVLLGLGAYGYDWAIGNPARSRVLSAPEALRQAEKLGIRIQWDTNAQVPYYQYWDAQGTRHVVYYENASSMAAKANLVNRHGLGGVAIWRLGLEDPAAWEGVIYGKLLWRRNK